MHTLTVIQVVAFLAAFAAQGSRVFVATRPFWSKLPAWLQVALPPIIPAFAALAQGLAGVATWTDLTVVLIGCAALVVPGLPSNRSSAPLQAGKAPTLSPSPQDVAVSANVVKMASIAPPERTFPSIAPSSDDTPKWGGPSGGLVLLLAVAFAWHATGCAPAKPPCDQAKMAVIVAECTARSQDCVNKGIAKDQCPSLDDCDSQIEKACQ